MKIAISTSSFASIDTTPLELLKTKGLQVVSNPFGRKMNEEEIITHLQGVDGLLALLPNKMQARAMLVEVQRIYHTYFETPKKRDAALMAAAYVEAHCRHNGDSGFYKCG